FFGVPVYQARVKVNLDRAGRPTMVLSAYAPHLARIDRFDPSPALTAEAAAARARQLAEVAAVATTPELGGYPAETPRLAWHLALSTDGAEWDVLLDAHSGEVIRVLDLSLHGHGGAVEIPDPESEILNEPASDAAPAPTPFTHSAIRNPQSAL